MTKFAWQLMVLPLLLAAAPAHVDYPGTAEIKRECDAALWRDARAAHKFNPAIGIASAHKTYVDAINDVHNFTDSYLAEIAADPHVNWHTSEGDLCVGLAVIRQRAGAKSK